ncbi:MAG: ABC transporter permease [Acetivibrionales bacterium]|jgi:rhamnose transport system permease protein
MENTKKNSVAKKILRPELSIFIFFIISIVAGTLISPDFLDLKYILSTMPLYTELGIIALAFTYLMIAGEIDLSVASALTLVSCVSAALYQNGMSMEAVIPIGILLGLVLGLFNGILVTATKIPSLIITLGSMSMYRGLAQVLIGDGSISGFPEWFVGIDRMLLFGVVPMPIVIFVVLTVIMEIILKKTFFGRKVVAVGSQPQVAVYSAVHVDRVKLVLFGLLGLSEGIAGLMSLSRLGLAKYSIGVGGELDIITMVLLGGTAFSGGRGSLTGTALAFLVIVLLKTSMTLVNLRRMDQLLVIGLMLIIVIILTDKLNKYQDQS